jgi:hypothetical protein
MNAEAARSFFQLLDRFDPPWVLVILAVAILCYRARNSEGVPGQAMTSINVARRGLPGTQSQFTSTRPSTTLADLFTLLFAANPFSAARASLRRWSSDEFEDGLAHGGQCRSRRRPVDSFFPALLF